MYQNRTRTCPAWIQHDKDKKKKQGNKNKDQDKSDVYFVKHFKVSQ